MNPLYELSVNDTLIPRAERFGVYISTHVTVCVSDDLPAAIFFMLFDMFQI